MKTLSRKQKAFKDSSYWFHQFRVMSMGVKAYQYMVFLRHLPKPLPSRYLALKIVVKMKIQAWISMQGFNLKNISKYNFQAVEETLVACWTAANAVFRTTLLEIESCSIEIIEARIDRSHCSI